jgi:glucokinase
MVTEGALLACVAPDSCKFALLHDVVADQPLMSAFREYRTEEVGDIEAAFRLYASTLQRPLPTLGGLAVSAPIHGDTIFIPQSGWTFSQEALKRQFGFERLTVINDAEACGTAVGAGAAGDAIPVGGSAPVSAAMANGRYALINLDHGLGVAAVDVGDGRFRVIDTEAGHLTFAPQSELELELYGRLQTIYGRVSYERLLAWPALSQIYALQRGRTHAGETLTPLEIVLAGCSGADPACAEVLRCYSEILGSFAGDVALALGIDQGVFLSGRFAFEAHEYVDWQGFRRRFEAKGRLAAMVSRLPTRVLASPKSVLLGVAHRIRLDAAAPAPILRGARTGETPAREATSVATGDVWSDLLETVSSGVLVLDGALKIVTSNARFWEGASVPTALREPGADIRAAFEAMAEGGDWSLDAAASAYDGLASGRAYALERIGAGGVVLRDEARLGPGGRWVITSQDITRSAKRGRELEQIAAELRVARNGAEAANRTKSAFLATMSHEIRTPLNGILGMAQVIAADKLPSVQKERVEIIRQSGETLLAILNDILDLSKIEAGQLELEQVEFDLKSLLLGAYSAFTVLANKKGLSFQLQLAPETEGAYRGDPTRLRQILYNMISNALKFTEAGEVRVSCWTEDGHVLFSIRDTGIGIDPERLSALFQRFVQADTSTTRKYGGTGLGLAICKELAERMGGSIRAQSAPGEGATFTISLPLERTADARVLAAPAGSATLAKPDQANAAPIKVLAAEDNEINRLVLRTLLHQLGVDLTIVEDGQALVSCWEQETWDVILMDVQMPRMDGPTATQVIRAREAAAGSAHIPIIALTANVMANQLEEYRRVGMDAYVAKPIQAAELFNAILRQVDGSEAEAEAEAA